MKNIFLLSLMWFLLVVNSGCSSTPPAVQTQAAAPVENPGAPPKMLRIVSARPKAPTGANYEVKSDTLYLFSESLIKYLQNKTGAQKRILALYPNPNNVSHMIILHGSPVSIPTGTKAFQVIQNEGRLCIAPIPSGTENSLTIPLLGVLVTEEMFVILGMEENVQFPAVPVGQDIPTDLKIQ